MNQNKDLETDIRSDDKAAAVLAGLGIPALCTFLTQLLFVWGKPFAYESAFAILICITASYFGYHYKQKARPLLWSIYLALPFGIIIDATIHINLHKYVYDHNLIPFEIIYFLILAPLPLCIGSVAGNKTALWHQLKSNTNDTG